MNDDELDQLLMEREEIVPSSGFLASVMEAVQQEADAPGPIPFPWKWAVPGFVVSVAMALGLVARWVYSSPHMNRPARPVAPSFSIETLSSSLPRVHIAVSTMVALEWSALAIVGSIAAAWISMRIAGVKE